MSASDGRSRRDGSVTNQFWQSPFMPSAPTGTERTKSMVGISRLITADDLSVVFQPIVATQTGRIFAYEALVRCRLEEFRYPPRLFERAGEEQCLGRLGRMIREVALPLVEHHPVFVNVHPTELQERWLVRPDDPLYFHDRAVFLEVTESVPLNHFELCRDVLNEVRSRAEVYLVVDDLGAGYSNLMRIADLEPRMVKLDRELVRELDLSPRRRRLVEGIVRMCTDLGAEVVAEGIETIGEAHAARDCGIQYLQGFLFARPGFPLPGVDASSLL